MRCFITDLGCERLERSLDLYGKAADDANAILGGQVDDVEIDRAQSEVHAYWARFGIYNHRLCVLVLMVLFKTGSDGINDKDIPNQLQELCGNAWSMPEEMARQFVECVKGGLPTLTRMIATGVIRSGMRDAGRLFR